ncbi:DUF550 domain-containing protein [Salmonella enterica]|nr:DUF550 domain-containing protein [Salmonella enterica subsp. enterica serovar Saintpaul]EAP1309292.1 DUF550 domain-containing protein [Salmonella enterica]EAQ3902594.1 DUF550 domain-containing protein [Salmonella enterica]EAR0424538.1 DUF550 domain-containing protein [Salmonella enterica subsp. enterica serovar Saintpaul]EAR8424340.1 DUF550 domain-containing protein [Salmonella enterica]
MTTITKERLLKIQHWRETYGADSNVMLPAEEAAELARIALASLDAEPVSQPYKLPEEKGASLQFRNLIRKRHAEWSDSTFGNVGPVGPLKHLSKEALEAAADPSDPLEWADMQFLLWDAQRRAGISDGEITAAMEEKLKVNMARQWPEPKDGEPRLHIKEQPAPVVPPAIEPDYKVIKSILPTANPDEYACCIAADMWNACRSAMLHGAEPVSQTNKLPHTQFEQVADLYEMQFDDGRTCAFHTDAQKAVQWLQACDGNRVQEYVKLERLQNALAGNSPVTPDDWISCSERMPDDGRHVIILCDGAFVLYAQYRDGEFFDIVRNGDEFFETQSRNVTDWTQLPEPPL